MHGVGCGYVCARCELCCECLGLGVCGGVGARVVCECMGLGVDMCVHVCECVCVSAWGWVWWMCGCTCVCECMGLGVGVCVCVCTHFPKIMVSLHDFSVTYLLLAFSM